MRKLFRQYRALLLILIPVTTFAMDENPTFVVLLNGTSCSGKTTLAKELCLQLKKAGFLGIRHLSIDDHYKNANFNLEQLSKTEKQNAHLPGWSKFFDSWHQEMTKSVDNFTPVVVDHVFDFNENFENFLKNLQDKKVIMVKVHCSKEVAEKRLNERNKIKGEQNRDSKIIDRHFNKLNTIHGDKIYDIEIDTTKSITKDDALTIVWHIIKQKPINAFKQNCRNHKTISE